MMKYVYSGNEEDNIVIADYKKQFETYTLEKLVKCYNRQVNYGITGVHRQALYLMALRQEFNERLKESPVYLLDHVLGLVGPIEIINDSIKIVS